jgi:hypothetical protein
MPIGVAVRQRLQHHGPDDAEDRGGGADAEGQRHQGGGGEAGRPLQDAAAMANVAERVLDQRGPNLIPGALPRHLETAELQQRLAPRFVWAQARPKQLLGLLIEVKTDLFIETALERVAPAHRPYPLPALGDASHDRPQLLKVASSTRLTARDMRRHCTSSSLKCRRPAAVSA